MKNYDITATGFFSSELFVRFVKILAKSKTSILNNEDRTSYYSIFYVTNGKFLLNTYGKSRILNVGDLFVAKPFEKYEVIALTENLTSNYVCVYFLTNLFENVKSDTDFLRAFNDRTKGEFNVYNPEDFSSPTVLFEIFKQYDYCFVKNVAFCHYAMLTGNLITQLDFAFDDKFSKRATDNSNDYAVKIYDYITSNFTTPITAEMMVEKFSISKWYLDKVTKKFYGLPFLKTIKTMRMWHSRELMKQNEFKMGEIAKLCGYNDYSAFYRCYTGFFGISPKEDLKIFRDTNKFYKCKF